MTDKHRKGFKLAAWLGIALLVSWQNLFEYIQADVNAFLGLCLLPFTLFIRKPNVYSWRYAFASGAFLLLFYKVHAQIFFLLGFGCFILFIIESQVGRLSEYPLYLLGLLSPVVDYFMTVFTFPIRLRLSEWAAAILRVFGFDTEASGNLFIVNGDYFSVDPACVGLNMMKTGLLIALLIMALGEKQHKKQLPIWGSAVLLGIAFGLLVVTNFIRILGIVLFHSAPNTLSHDLIGLVTLVLFTILPLYGIIQKAYIHLGMGAKITDRKAQEKDKPLPFGIDLGLGIVLLLSLAWFNTHREDFRHEASTDAFANLQYGGFEKSYQDNGVVRFQNDSLLMYVKPPVPFWGTDHTPAICWRGSGFEFGHIRSKRIAQKTIYVGYLQQEDKRLYTAWWYENDELCTVSQFEWRWRMAKGEEPFRLINVTAFKEEVLLRQCERMLR